MVAGRRRSPLSQKGIILGPLEANLSPGNVTTALQSRLFWSNSAKIHVRSMGRRRIGDAGDGRHSERAPFQTPPRPVQSSTNPAL